MKTLALLLFLCAASVAVAANRAAPTITSLTIEVPGGDYDIAFSVTWFCDDNPQLGAPGHLELFNPTGQKIGDVTVGINQWGDAQSSISGPGSVTIQNSYVVVSTPSGEVADGGLSATWHIPGLSAGTYTVKLWGYTSWTPPLHTTTIWTTTYFVSGSAPNPPPVEPPLPPPPATYTLNVSAGAGGAASGGGVYSAGTVVSVVAAADSENDFVGWNGDVDGAANPLTLTMDRDWNVQANFAPVALPLATRALGGGNVSPGGSYPFGTWVTVSAVADSMHYFTGWTGDAGGASPSVNVFMDRAKSVQAMFAAKASQVISFAGPGDQAVGATPILSATTSSGLPAVFSVVSGPAMLSGNMLTVTGSGPIAVQAAQAGDAYTLSAPPVSVTFNAIAAPAKVRVQSVARTILRDARTPNGGSYVLGNP